MPDNMVGGPARPRAQDIGGQLARRARANRTERIGARADRWSVSSGQRYLTVMERPLRRYCAAICRKVVEMIGDELPSVIAGAIGASALGIGLSAPAWEALGGWESVVFAVGSALVGALIAGVSTASYRIWKEDQETLAHLSSDNDRECDRAVATIGRWELNITPAYPKIGANELLMRLDHKLAEGVRFWDVTQLVGCRYDLAYKGKDEAESLLCRLVTVGVLARENGGTWENYASIDDDGEPRKEPIGKYTLTSDLGVRVLQRLRRERIGN